MHQMLFAQRDRGLALDGTSRDTFNELVLCTEENDQLRQDGDQGQRQDLVQAKPVSPSMDSFTNRDMGYLPGVLT